METSPPPEDSSLALSDFQALAEWRYQIRRFLSSAEGAARSVGLEPQQHQLLLAVKGLPQGMIPTMGVIAERMAVRPHTIVELVDRLAQRGLIRRQTNAKDRRSVLLVLTSRAEWLLQRLSEQHRQQLQSSGPELVQAIGAVLGSKLAPVPASAMDPLHVLCVDDEPRILQGLKLNLEPRYRISVATGGAQALEVCAADPPAVIISDLRMPDMDGTTFLARARMAAPYTVRILLTGQADLDAAVAAVNEARVFRFLTKPCRPPVLLSAIEDAGNEHRSLIGTRGKNDHGDPVL
jgi:CheY-like chemotaxis protein/DNA-binding MarR family transcriptional regulator